jgi:O-antigen/teichoic acid export membrane protein
MGIVQKQGVRQSLVTYLGMALGAFNLLWLYPLFLSKEQIGITKFVLDSAVLAAPFLFWGGAELIVRFFPKFRDERNGHNGYLFLLHVIFAVGILLLLLLVLLLKDTILGYFSDKSPLFVEFLPYAVPLALLLTYAAIFTSYTSNFHKIVVPTIFNEIIPKLAMTLLVLAFAFNFWGFQGIFWGQIVGYFAVLVGQIWYTASLGQLHWRPNFGFYSPKLLKEVYAYGVFGLIGTLGSRIGERINTILLGTMTSLADTGVYTVAFFLSDAIDAPRRAISRISSPIISDKWAEGKIEDIQEIYQKSALNQLIVGLGLLLAVWVSIDEIFSLMPNGEQFREGKYVILILGLARVLDMLTGVNTEIISYSKNYRYNFYFIILLALSSIGFSWLLIPIFAVNGAALATLVSLAIYNFLKFAVLWSKFKLQPFSWPILWVMLIGLFAYFAVTLLPKLSSPLLGLLLNSLTASLVYVGFVLHFKLSVDFSNLIDKIWKRVS